MHLKRSSIGVALAASIVACSGGSAPPERLPSIAPDPPTSSQDSPASVGCAPCSGNLRCVGTTKLGTPIDAVVSTTTNQVGECALNGDEPITGLRLQCDGQVVGSTQTPRGNQETSLGTWSPAGDGVVVCIAGTCLLCPPTTDPAPAPTPQPTPVGGGGNGTQADGG